MTIIEIIGNCITAIATACAPVIAYALLAKLGLEKNALANQIVTTAITRGTGLAVAEGVAKGDPLLTLAENKEPAVKTAVNYVQSVAAPELKRLGVSDEMVATKIASQLALTLNTPTITVATGPSKT
jgi:hypothetical protein